MNRSLAASPRAATSSSSSLVAPAGSVPRPGGYERGPGLHRQGELDLLLGRQQRCGSDLIQVGAEQIAVGRPPGPPDTPAAVRGRRHGHLALTSDPVWINAVVPFAVPRYPNVAATNMTKSTSRVSRGALRTVPVAQARTAWISSWMSTLSPRRALSPPSGTLNSIPYSLRLIDLVAVKPARVPPQGSSPTPLNSTFEGDGEGDALDRSSPSSRFSRPRCAGPWSRR